MRSLHTRRQWLLTTGSALTGALLSRQFAWASKLSSPVVSIAKCRTYDKAELLPAVERMFDQIGGLGRFVKGKTVAIKINLTGPPSYRLGYAQLGDTHYTNPQVMAAVVHLMGKAGARRIRLYEAALAQLALLGVSFAAILILRLVIERRRAHG